MESDEIGCITLGNLSVVTLLRLKAAFLQMASEARAAEDFGAEGFLTELAGIVETAESRTVKAMFSPPGGPVN